MNGSEEFLQWVIVGLVFFTAGWLTKRRREAKDNTNYRSNGKHEQ